jgi:ABC-type multidrug transport system permease subunit
MESRVFPVVSLWLVLSPTTFSLQLVLSTINDMIVLDTVEGNLGVPG